MGERKMHKGRHFEFLWTMSQLFPFLEEVSRSIKWRSGQSKFSTFWPEDRGPPESLRKGDQRFSRYLKPEEQWIPWKSRRPLSHWVLFCWLLSCFLNPSGI